MTPLYTPTNFDQNSFKSCLMTRTQPKKTSWRVISASVKHGYRTLSEQKPCVRWQDPLQWMLSFLLLSLIASIYVYSYEFFRYYFLDFMWICCAAGEGGGIHFIFIHTNPYTVLLYIFYLQCRGVKISLACRPHAAPLILSGSNQWSCLFLLLQNLTTHLILELQYISFILC